MMKVPTELKPHFGVVIIFHIVSSVCVGVLLILVHDYDLFYKLDPFRLILLSLVLTTPVTAICFSLLFVAVTIFKGQSLKAGNVDTAAHSLVAAMISLLALTSVSVGRYCKWWTNPHESTKMAGIFGGILLLLALGMWWVRKWWWRGNGQTKHEHGEGVGWPLRPQVVVTQEEGEEIKWIKTIIKKRHKPPHIK